MPGGFSEADYPIDVPSETEGEETDSETQTPTNASSGSPEKNPLQVDPYGEVISPYTETPIALETDEKTNTNLPPGWGPENDPNNVDPYGPIRPII